MVVGFSSGAAFIKRYRNIHEIIKFTFCKYTWLMKILCYIIIHRLKAHSQTDTRRYSGGNKQK
ncbi:hypothetical protein D3501_23035 [Salmonella enterica]|nr:hypothetical protein [Salmonella enterica]EBM7196650.1 hypothetical protein [Salmonella enterica]